MRTKKTKPTNLFAGLRAPRKPPVRVALDYERKGKPAVQPGSAPPCYRCGSHRDANVHIAGAGTASTGNYNPAYHKYVGKKEATIDDSRKLADCLEYVAIDLLLMARNLKAGFEIADGPFTADPSTYAIEAQAAVHALLVLDGEIEGNPDREEGG